MVTLRENRAAPAFVYSSIAQSVERMTVNHDAVGSSPTGGAKKNKSEHLQNEVFGFVFLPWEGCVWDCKEKKLIVNEFMETSMVMYSPYWSFFAKGMKLCNHIENCAKRKCK